MAGFCLPKFASEALQQKFTSGEFNPERLAEMTSAERRGALAFLGEANAKQVNALFESKLLLKNQQLGMINWAKQILGKKPDTLRDTLSKIERMGEVMNPKEIDAFLEDLIEKKLGVHVSIEETGKLMDIAKRTKEAQAKVAERDANDPTYEARQKAGNETPEEFAERMEWGISKALFNDYVGSLKPGGKSVPFTEILKNPRGYIPEIASFVKTFKSTFDLSFMGNQGIISLWNPATLVKGMEAFATSVKTAYKTLGGTDAALLARAEAYSRVNALRGHYQRMKVAIGISTEEALPSSLPERIPGLGRLFKASNDAYNASAVKLRADLADRMIEISKKNGEDITDKAHAEALGEVVNSSTGRGGLRSFEASAKSLNLWFYSIRLLKGATNTLTAHIFDPKVWTDKTARKVAVKNLVYSGLTYVTVMQIIEALNPGSTDLDPRSAHFGQVRIGNSNTWINVTGAYRPILRTAASILPTMKDGKWGFWRKSAAGKWQRVEWYPKKALPFGQYTPLDAFQDFFTGKAAPVWSWYFGHLKGSLYNGELPTIGSDVSSFISPISVSSYLQDKDNPKVDSLMINTIANFLGLNATTYKK